MAEVLMSLTRYMCAATCLVVVASGVGAAPKSQEPVIVRAPFPPPDPPMPWDGVPKEFQFLFRGGISESLDEVWAALPFDSITLTRSGCRTCPAYNVTLFRGRLNPKRPESYEDRFGQAELKVTRAGRDSDQYRRFPTATGEFTGAIDIWTFGNVSYLIQRSDFGRLEDHYPVSRVVTDSATATVSVSGPASTKSVGVTARMGPIELWAIQEAIDSAAKSINWKRK